MYKFGDKVQLKPRDGGYMSASRREVLDQTGIIISKTFDEHYSVCFEAPHIEGFLYQVEFCTESELVDA